MTSTESSTHCAKVVKRWGCDNTGRFGLLGFSAHCELCGYLSRRYDNVFGAHEARRTHVCPPPEDA